MFSEFRGVLSDEEGSLEDAVFTTSLGKGFMLFWVFDLVLIAALRESDLKQITEYSNPGIGLVERLGSVLFNEYCQTNSQLRTRFLSVPAFLLTPLYRMQIFQKNG